MRFCFALLFAAACFAQTAAPTLVSIAITPANPAVAVASDLQLVAAGTYSDGSFTVLTALAGWSSAVPGVATVSGGGLVTGVTVGPSTITASVAGISATAIVTVTAAVSPVTGCTAISAWYLLAGQAENAAAIASTPQYKWALLDPSIVCYFDATGQPHLTMATVVGGSPLIGSFECRLVGGDTCLVTHNLNSVAPLIGQVIVNSGCGTCFAMGSFTPNSFVVSSALAADLTFVVQYAPPSALATESPAPAAAGQAPN
jgi:hypothetical protein